MYVDLYDVLLMSTVEVGLGEYLCKLANEDAVDDDAKGLVLEIEDVLEKRSRCADSPVF